MSLCFSLISCPNTVKNLMAMCCLRRSTVETSYSASLWNMCGELIEAGPASIIGGSLGISGPAAAASQTACYIGPATWRAAGTRRTHGGHLEHIFGRCRREFR